jgi:micrococcal nuclease
MYSYKAELVRVVDGDTVVLDVDLGFNTTLRETFRLAGINAPESRGPERIEGKAAAAHLIGLLCNESLTIDTLKDSKGKYGRYLAYLYIEDQGKKININYVMVLDGFAELKDY